MKKIAIFALSLALLSSCQVLKKNQEVENIPIIDVIRGDVENWETSDFELITVHPIPNVGLDLADSVINIDTNYITYDFVDFSISFSKNKYHINSQNLKKLYSWFYPPVTGYPDDIYFLVTGKSDISGDWNRNVFLAEKRAISGKNALINIGHVEDSLIKTSIRSNIPSEDYKSNRCVTFKVIKKSEISNISDIFDEKNL
jgi:outer membrane protein OmpA-like peptidoglycan-associated protein